MRFIYITCNVSMQEQMESLLRELEISVYQVIPKALAESNRHPAQGYRRMARLQHMPAGAGGRPRQE